MNEKSWEPIIIGGWGGTVPRPYIPIGYKPTWPTTNNGGTDFIDRENGL